jgi:hypothetical protein
MPRPNKWAPCPKCGVNCPSTGGRNADTAQYTCAAHGNFFQRI